MRFLPFDMQLLCIATTRINAPRHILLAVMDLVSFVEGKLLLVQRFLSQTVSFPEHGSDRFITARL